jgi:chromosome segregation ATPase
MLFPQEKRPTSETPAGATGSPAAPTPPPQQVQPYIVNNSSGVKISILFGAVIALLGASVYLFYQVSQVRSELAETRDSLANEISKLNETSNVSTQTSRRTIESLKDSLKKELDRTRAQAAQLSGQAKAEAEQHADSVASQLRKMQDEQGKKIDGFSTEVSQVKSDATAANAKIDGVSTEVGSVKTDVAKTKSELEKTIADLKSTRGDLGVQSGLIATNGKELSALKALGERNYTDFKIAKTKAPQKVGDLQVLLKSTDPKKNKYTIEVIADDKRVEKKDRSVNEPVQFLLSRATQPYELVVNDIKKDLIVGYVAAPKVQQKREIQPAP